MTTPLTLTTFREGGQSFAYNRTLVMGILNVTPDSFSDGGAFSDPSIAVRHAQAMRAQGADIIDIGGESTRPGHHGVSADDEIARIGPVLAALHGKIDTPLSIDTTKPSVAARGLQLGAVIINDVWGLQKDPDMARVIAAFDASVIIMHNRETVNPDLDIIADIMQFMHRSLHIAREAGIADHRIALDPGIGFGKTQEQNLQIIAQLDRLKTFEKPILLGASRKSVIGNIVAVPPHERLAGTLCLHGVGIFNGANLVRVHDVAAGVQAARVADALRLYRPASSHFMPVELP